MCRLLGYVLTSEPCLAVFELLEQGNLRDYLRKVSAVLLLMSTDSIEEPSACGIGAGCDTGGPADVWIADCTGHGTSGEQAGGARAAVGVCG